ncbi:MAG: triose-phosphate isomerase [Deltaproteobacteria bacterium]|nr:triose-phosphate isomerase [Deltaproteobacteria bacterium]MBW2070518.1 triose-phosphate isomerase [Deltaproteobacteria bacterium]
MSPRTPLLAGNWKMHFTVAEALTLVRELEDGLQKLDDRQVVVAPPYTALAEVSRVLAGSPIEVAAQNCHWESQGAYTGEVSVGMLADVGCRYVIVGHSERRQYFAETDESVNLKVKAVIEGGLTAIVCVGETLAERQAGNTLKVLERQLLGAFAGLSEQHEFSRLVLAYEPVWAIGTGQTATTEQAQEAHAFLRGKLAERFNKNVANEIRILYGGSVKPENVDALMAQPDIDGALVGGASLQAASFRRIVAFET